MQTTFFHKNLTKEEESLFVDYVSTKLPAIKDHLSGVKDNEQLLKISIEKFEKHAAFQVEFRLSLPGKIIFAKEDSHHVSKAVDLAKDRLLSQLRKYIELLHKERDHQSIREEI